MATASEFTSGAAQAAPVYFDREASTDKACELIREAGKLNVDLLAFGESWLPGYPFFHPTSHLEESRVRYLENAVEIPSPTRAPVRCRSRGQDRRGNGGGGTRPLY